MTDQPGQAQFPPDLDRHIPLSAGGEVYFGPNVLRGLVDGLREAADRPRTASHWGPGVLGCTMWMDDPEVIDVLAEMANVCIIVTKQRANDLAKDRANAVRELAESSGLAHAAFPELADFAPRQASRPLVVGPYTSDWSDQTDIGAVREVGFRKIDNRLVPIVHAKIALLGRMGWTDEHPTGHIDDHLFFTPERLWIGSANFTRSSRSSLEMGLWTQDPDLMAAARRFLLTLVTLSEPLGTGPDPMEPELLPVKYDDDAIWEYLHDVQLDEHDDDR